VQVGSRPSALKQRHCARGSGGGRPHLSNLCILPAWTRSLISPAAETIPRIFRIMDTSAVTARTLQEHQIRRSGQVVQNRSLRSVRWADIPVLSTCVGRCPAAWLQCWLQSHRNGAAPRPSAFQAGHIPSWRRLCVSYLPSSVAANCRWSLLLLSPLLSIRLRGLSLTVVSDLR